MDPSSQSGLPTMGSSPNSDEQLESARHTQVSLDISEGEVHDSDDNVQLSSFQQWKLVMKKSALLMSRDTSNTLCMCLSPAIIILAISALVLLGGDDSYDPSLGITYSMRDSSMTAMAVDKNKNDASIFKSQKQLVGDVLFATASTSEVPLTSTANGISVENLCKFVMNDARDIYTASVSTSTQGLYRQAYKDAKAVDSSFTIMPTTCSGGNSDGTTGTCTCASGTQIFDSIESLEDKMLALADTGSYKPVMAAVVIDEYKSSDKQLSWYFYYNRTLVSQAVNTVNDFTFYNSMYWQTYTAGGFLPVQRLVDSYFAQKMSLGDTSASDPEIQFQPFFQSFPMQDYKYNASKFGFLNGWFQLFFGFCIIFPLSAMVTSIVDEKKRRIKEGMMMMGLSNAVFWMSWISVFTIVFTLVAFLCTCASFVFLFRHSNFGIVFGFLLTYLYSVMGLGLWMSTLFTDPGTASITSIFIYLIGIFSPSSLTGLSKNFRIVISVILSPFSFYWGFSIFGQYEGSNQGITSGILSKATEQGFTDPVDFTTWWWICLADVCWYIIAAWYCDQVVPGEFGAKQPFYFCILPSYWCSSYAGDRQASDATDEDEFDPADFQKVDEAKLGKPAIEVRNLRKVFWSNNIEKIAVHNFSVDVYEGQCTALLGHNGAGKTTTFNMLSGLMPPSKGDAQVYGRSIKTDLVNVRKNLGVCPQHDVLWDQLTVMEHLQLFAALKGVPPEKIDRLCYNTIAAVGLTEKVHQYSVTLSGGQKRKLSIGIATIGNSKVVYLDEPTSGMDPFSRRSTWNVIKAHTPGHVIIFTTHFMDEADLLGDRIAIMSEGMLRCVGDSLFLKQRWGLGYHLTISKHVGLDAHTDQKLSNEIQMTVKRNVPDLDMENDFQRAGAEMSFQLPKGSTTEEAAKYREQFIGLFADLDSLRDANLKDFDSWGISMTTLEEVFLKLAADAHANDPAHRKQTSELTSELRESRSGSAEVSGNTMNVGSRVSGGSGFGTHVKAVITKRALSTLRNLFNAVIQILVPLIFIILACIAIKYGLDLSAHDFDVDASQFNTPLYLPVACSSTATCPATTSRVSQLSTTVTTVEAQPIYTNAVQFTGSSSDLNVNSKQFTCDSYSVNQKLGFPFGSASSAQILMKDVEGFYSGVVTPSTLTPDCVKQNTCTQSGSSTSVFLPSDLYSCSSSNQDMLDMGNFLYDNRNEDGKVATKTTKYGAISFDCGTSNTIKCPYVAQYNGSAYNGIITYANMANNLLLKEVSSDTANIQLKMKAGPWTGAEKGAAKTGTAITLAFFLIIAFSIVPASYVYELVQEVKVKAKHQQMISGVKPGAYWLATYLWDFVYFIIPAILAICIVLAFEQEQFYKEKQFLPFLFIFLFYGLASIPQTYIMSFMYKDPNQALMNCVAVYAVSGFLLFLVSFILGQIENTQDFNDKFQYILYFSPQYAFAKAIYNLSQYYYNPAFNSAVCKCVYSSPWDMGVAGTGMTYMGCLSGAYFFIVLVMQAGTTSMDGLLAKCFHKSPEVPPDPEYDIDDDVVAESELVDRLGDGDLDNLDQSYLDDHMIIVKHLRKVFYGRGNISSKVAVRDVSFQVPTGEVFAYLGINGAGKTTSISMMAGEFPPTTGSGKLAGLDMLKDREEINKYMGYCPQFDALFPKLTAREHLSMYARIKGISADTQDAVVQQLIDMMNLSSHCDREAGGYSGGNKRKLSVAIALLGGPKIVFLDEPSTGMDPEARRFMWKVISDTMSGRSVILTTHSMEEAEALSNRITIMVGGRLRCIGTNQHLKDKFGKGYSLEIRAEEEYNAAIQKWIKEIFPNSKVKENLGNQLRFKVPMDQKLSQAWSRVEEGKAHHGVEEYAISQTTLEQVFVRFASEQEEETGMDGAALAASIRQVIPNFVDMCLCRPKKEYQWTVDLHNGNKPLNVEVHFNFGACLCCKSNPGIVTVNGDPVKRLDEYGQETDEDLVLLQRTNPGCVNGDCCGCASCCGCDDCFCCRNTQQTFRHSGKLFEVVDYSEIPGTGRARPCFLMVEGKDGEMHEADTGIARGQFLSTMFEQGGKKYCYIIGLPLVILFIACLIVPAVRILAIVLFIFLIWFCTWCICGNWCGRSSHYRNSPNVHFVSLPGAAPQTTSNQLQSQDRPEPSNATDAADAVVQDGKTLMPRI